MSRGSRRFVTKLAANGFPLTVSRNFAHWCNPKKKKGERRRKKKEERRKKKKEERRKEKQRNDIRRRHGVIQNQLTDGASCINL